MEARLVASPDRRSRPAGERGSARRPHGERTPRLLRAAGLLAALVWTTALQAATVNTRNFVVHAPTQEIAEQVGRTAEHYRRELAIAWLGKELPAWYRPCPIKVKVGQIGAGGATTFTFERGEVFGWNMTVQGSLERILDSVVPHEVSHTIFASHFRRPLPRWADEGAATLVEHESERLRQTRLLNQVIRTTRRIPLQRLLEITEYPDDMQQVLTLYAEGYSLADFLVQQKGDEGRATYLAFLHEAHEHNWAHAFRKYYGFQNLNDVEQQWTSWVLAGSPPLPQEGHLLADAGQPRSSAVAIVATSPERSAPPANTALVRGQNLPVLPPLPPIARQLRTRIDGRELDAPEPSVTARPDRETTASPAAAAQTRALEAAPPIPLDNGASAPAAATVPAIPTGGRPPSRRSDPRQPQAAGASFDEAFAR